MLTLWIVSNLLRCENIAKTELKNFEITLDFPSRFNSM